MPIPPLNADGFLPVGIFECTLEEAKTRFGGFKRTDQRPALWRKFEQYVSELKKSQLAHSVLMDGSFVTAKDVPGDLDLIIELVGGHDFSRDLEIDTYNLLSKRRVYRRFGFDILVARRDSKEFFAYVAFFQQVRFEPNRNKGILKIAL